MKNLRLSVSLTGVIEAVQCPCTSWASSDVGRQSGSLAVSSTQLDLSLVCLDYHPAVGHRQVLFFLILSVQGKNPIYISKKERERERDDRPSAFRRGKTVSADYMPLVLSARLSDFSPRRTNSNEFVRSTVPACSAHLYICVFQLRLIRLI